MTLTIAMAILLLVASVPYWLPRAVVALRMHIFTRINGDEGIPIPGKLVEASRFKQVYSDRAADGRSHGAVLSDLFWYWLSPGPEIHQEHIEPGERYDQVARATRRILSISRRAARELCIHSVRRVLHRAEISGTKLVRLRDLLMPLWADFYYQLVFGEASTALARQLIVDNANDVVTALKCCGLRHMGRRHRLTQFLIAKLEAGEVPHPLPESLSTRERALYLQGTFFNTAVVQMSEAMVHLLLALAQHQEIQARLAAHPEDERYFDRVIDETLRLYPLFGISHRIASADIALDERTSIPKGTVLCFNHPQFHQVGFEHPDRFDPDRWEHLSAYQANYIPFGVSANRPCLAQGLAPLTMRVAAVEILRHFALYSSASHTRSIPHRGPCVLVPRVGQANPRVPHLHLIILRFRDRLEDCWRSVVQLILGTYMVWDARRQRLCQRYFEAEGSWRSLVQG